MKKKIIDVSEFENADTGKMASVVTFEDGTTLTVQVPMDKIVLDDVAKAVTQRVADIAAAQNQLVGQEVEFADPINGTSGGDIVGPVLPVTPNDTLTGA